MTVFIICFGILNKFSINSFGFVNHLNVKKSTIDVIIAPKVFNIFKKFSKLKAKNGRRTLSVNAAINLNKPEKNSTILFTFSLFSSLPIHSNTLYLIKNPTISMIIPKMPFTAFFAPLTIGFSFCFLFVLPDSNLSCSSVLLFFSSSLTLSRIASSNFDFSSTSSCNICSNVDLIPVSSSLMLIEALEDATTEDSLFGAGTIAEVIGIVPLPPPPPILPPPPPEASVTGVDSPSGLVFFFLTTALFTADLTPALAPSLAVLTAAPIPARIPPAAAALPNDDSIGPIAAEIAITVDSFDVRFLP